MKAISPFYFSKRKLLLSVTDLLVINGAFVFSLYLWIWAIPTGDLTQTGALPGYLPWFMVITGVWLILAPVHDCYNLKVAANTFDSAIRILMVIVQLGIICLLVFYLILPIILPRPVFILFLPLSLALLVSWRFTYSTIFRMPRFKQKVLIVGAGWAGRTIAQEIHHNLGDDYEILGFIDDDPNKRGQIIEGVKVVGGRENIANLAKPSDPPQVILAITNTMHADLYQSIMNAYEKGIRVIPMAVFYEGITGRIPVEHLGNYWFAALPMGVDEVNVYSFFKRGIDIVSALVGLIVLGLLLPFIALAIRLDSPGPIFYVQERVGKNGRIFPLIKFRSMVLDAEVEGKAVWASPSDSRVTHVGRFFRLTRLDELPQFLNILKGEMSLVGPRPERPSLVEEIQEQIPFYRSRLLVKPGLTGWAQIKYRYGNSVEDALIKLQYDLYYIKHQSFYLDFLVGLKTIGVVLSLRGT